MRDLHDVGPEEVATGCSLDGLGCRRARFRQVVAFAAEFYRQLLRAQAGAAQTDDADLDRVVRNVLSTQPINEEATATRLERCLEASEQINRNANQTTLIETWLDDLARA